MIIKSRVIPTAIEFMERQTILFVEEYLGKPFPDSETALLQSLPEGSELAAFFRSALYSADPTYVVLHTDNSPEIQTSFFDIMIENYGTGQYRRQHANLKASVLFLTILSRSELSLDLYGKSMKDADYVPAIISFIEKNYASITVQDVADAFGFSRAHVGRIFKNHTGKTLQEAIGATRLRNAEEILHHKGYSIEGIGQMVGFDDVTNFIRRFRSTYGLTPHQYQLARFAG